MEIIINCPKGASPIWNHFLLKNTEVLIKFIKGNTITEEKMIKTGSGFRFELLNSIEAIEIVIRSFFRFNGNDYPLLNIFQRFNVVKENNIAKRLEARQWQKMRPDQSMGITKVNPPLHPLLRLNGSTVTVVIEFVDITRLFNDIHGDTPWFRAIELLRSTPRTIRVLASLRGHPFIWYVVIPKSVNAKKELQPNLLYLPFDYGGIYYTSESIEGITTPFHSTSIMQGNTDVQCGGEILFSFLTKPITDSDYNAKLKKFLEITDRFKNRKGNNPPALHHFRNVLTYDPSGDNLVPNFWDIPFGFEQALYEKQQILFIPQINGTDGGITTQERLMSLVENGLSIIYTHSNTLTYETMSVNKLILTCYSQSGGNLFTAAYKNIADIKALICFEPNYMNKYEKSEIKSLMLGKDIIPLLLKQGGKIAIVGRRTLEKKNKYLPLGVNPGDLILLPDESHYSILDYPPYNRNSSLVLKRRYSRLLKGSSDPIINTMLTQESGVIDFASANEEAKVEDIILKYRKAGFDDEKIINTVFTNFYNEDIHPGGFFTHNFIISSGQELAEDGESVFTFFHQALNLIN
ncbi:hypothetical protein [Bacillus sp. dmp10]|uniref:hypothetical protein n=1 Tax=Bacillus sp. dmp10 TaxID=2293321 RepID=UPI000E2EA2BF|nr:hypothetical protein DZB83_18920 [Bacillus sp. dmp10]